METIETIEYKGYQIKIHPDSHAEDPSANDDGWVGELLHWHRRYTFCKRARSIRELGIADLKQLLSNAFCHIPVGLLDHSGLHLYEGSNPHISDAGGWDSGQVGFLIASKDRVRELFSPHVTKETVLNALRMELKILDNWIRGNACGYTIWYNDVELSKYACWGYYESDEAILAAKETVDYLVKKEYESRDMHAPCVLKETT